MTFTPTSGEVLRCANGATQSAEVKETVSTRGACFFSCAKQNTTLYQSVTPARQMAHFLCPLELSYVCGPKAHRERSQVGEGNQSAQYGVCELVGEMR